jgi:predicted phage terminase large subunit-like protein
MSELGQEEIPEGTSSKARRYPSRVRELVLERALAKARESFPAYRRLVRRDMAWGWWVQEISEQLQLFFEDLITGKRPKLVVEAPPQHGKSWAATDFAAWVSGKNPDTKTIFASYSEALGRRTNRELQRRFRSPRHEAIFGRPQIGVPGYASNEWHIEYTGYAGSFRNTTVDGPVNGQELHLGIIDDPVKGRLEANSKLIRDNTWAWLMDDFLSRFADRAGLLLMMTRWHVDDPVGRMMQKYPNMKVLRYPAIAETDEPHRCKGEALFPQLKPLDFLRERQNGMSQASWESQYQQNPFIVGGGQLPVAKLQIMPVWDPRWIPKSIVASVRYWDKAGTVGDPDAAFTAGVLAHKLNDGRYVIEHVVHGQWSALDRETRIKVQAQRDAKECKNYQVWVEQEPGSGGKESAENTLRNLAGFRAYADRVTGSKEVRAEPFCAQVQAGNVYLVAGEWVTNFLDEAEAWPNGKHKDQIDAAAGAFAKLIAGSTYNLNFKEWAY